jgi:hypothetical protein
MVGEAELLPLTVQRYYALDFKSAVVRETQPGSPKERLLTSPN